MKRQMLAAPGRAPTQRGIDRQLDKALRSKGRQAHTLPERLVDALTLDTADYQDRGWSRPPAAREVVYGRAPEAAPGVVARPAGRRLARTARDLPTVARFLLAGRPLPRIEDAVRIGELMRRAALAQFGWRRDEVKNHPIPLAPPEISGRDSDGKPLKNPSHQHAFWLPEDADGDGWIDHVSVFIAGGINREVQAGLDRITRLWLAPKQRSEAVDAEPGSVKEWRLALEGFGRPPDFAGGARIFGTSRHWRSATPLRGARHEGSHQRGRACRNCGVLRCADGPPKFTASHRLQCGRIPSPASPARSGFRLRRCIFLRGAHAAPPRPDCRRRPGRRRDAPNVRPWTRLTACDTRLSALMHADERENQLPEPAAACSASTAARSASATAALI